jgi:hypothetical protein
MTNSIPLIFKDMLSNIWKIKKVYIKRLICRYRNAHNISYTGTRARTGSDKSIISLLDFERSLGNDTYNSTAEILFK